MELCFPLFQLVSCSSFLCFSSGIRLARPEWKRRSQMGCHVLDCRWLCGKSLIWHKHVILFELFLSDFSQSFKTRMLEREFLTLVNNVLLFSPTKVGITPFTLLWGPASLLTLVPFSNQRRTPQSTPFRGLASFSFPLPSGLSLQADTSPGVWLWYHL